MGGRAGHGHRDRALPTSNLFLGSGLFDLAAADGALGLGTDIGAGTSFSLLVTARTAYDAACLRGATADPLRLWYWRRWGGAFIVLGDPERYARPT